MNYHLEVNNDGDCGELQYEGKYDIGQKGTFDNTLSDLTSDNYAKLHYTGGLAMSEPIEDDRDFYSIYVKITAPDAARPD
jgi:hypothetical protein